MESGESEVNTSTAGHVVVRDLAGGVREVLMSDPAGRNVLDATMRDALRRSFEQAIADSRVRSLIVGTSTRNFSVGGGIADIAGLAPGQQSHARMAAVGDLVRMLGDCTKPTVAAINGHCMGAAAGLALLCDTIIFGRSASMGFPFLKIGLVPDFGISHTLALRVGHPVARQILMFAKTLGADEALHVGLVDELVADAEVLERSREVATQLARMPANALRLTREMLRQPGRTLDDCARDEAMRQALCFGSPDVIEGIAAFKQKRAPDFLRPHPGDGVLE